MKFWWMFDNHTFRDLGTNLDVAIAAARDLFEEDSWGSIFAHDEHGNSIKPSAMGHGRDRKPEFIAALAAFREDVMASLDPQI